MQVQCKYNASIMQVQCKYKSVRHLFSSTKYFSIRILFADVYRTMLSVQLTMLALDTCEGDPAPRPLWVETLCSATSVVWCPPWGDGRFLSPSLIWEWRWVVGRQAETDASNRQNTHNTTQHDKEMGSAAPDRLLSIMWHVLLLLLFSLTASQRNVGQHRALTCLKSSPA